MPHATTNLDDKLGILNKQTFVGVTLSSDSSRGIGHFTGPTSILLAQGPGSMVRSFIGYKMGGRGGQVKFYLYKKGVRKKSSRFIIGKWDDYHQECAVPKATLR